MGYSNPEKDTSSGKSYDRIYLTKYRDELKKNDIEEDVESFLNRAFYQLLEERVKQRKEHSQEVPDENRSQ